MSEMRLEDLERQIRAKIVTEIEEKAYRPLYYGQRDGDFYIGIQEALAIVRDGSIET